MIASSLQHTHFRINYYSDRIGAQNLATIRKLILAALSKDKILKYGKDGKRMAAVNDPKYLEKLLKIIF